MSLTYTSITGTFADGQGNPLSGSATFTPNTTVYAAGIPVVEAGVPVVAQIAAGQLLNASGGTLRLVATDNAGLTYAGQTGFLFWTVTVTVAGQVLPSWSFFLPSSPSTVDLYSLANTPASGGGGFTNPMTTLGDLIDGGVSGVAQRLPGNTSATRKFLRSQGSGSVAAAPAWDTLQAGDLPAATTGAQGAVQLAGDLAGTATSPQVTGTHLASPLPLAQGGTGQNAANAAALLAALGAAALASAAFTGEVTVQAPVNPSDAATKAYVDSVAAGLDAKPSAKVVATANLTLSGTQTVDGVACVAGDLVLATGQSTASQNGLWIVAAGAWSRPSDFATGSSQLGAFVFIEGGTAGSSSGWVLVGTAPVVVDTGSQTWTQFSGAGEINAGTGLAKSGNTLSIENGGVLTAAHGGTGQATLQAAINALAGAVTSGQVLRGNGANVVLAALQAGDLPVATTSAQGAVTLDGTAGDIQPDGTQGAGAVGKAADAGHVHPFQPWQFPAAAYGAKGDGRPISDGAMTSASAVLTSASGPFTSADAGKPILVAGAGNAAGRTTLVTTIASYQSATQVTLTASAAATVSGAWCVYGTDDTAAINSAVSAAYTWWQNNNYRQPEIIMPAIYMIAGAPTQGGSTKGNAQIPLPFVPMTGQRFEPTFTGQPEAPSIPYGLSPSPGITGGTLVCARTDGTNNGTYGPASVIGGYTRQQGAGDSVMANIQPVINGITIVVPYASTYCGFDFYGCTGLVVRSAAVQAWATTTQMANPNAGDFIGKTWVFGMRTPVSSNDSQIAIWRYAALGQNIGILHGEHVYSADLAAYFCYYGIQGYVDGSGSPMVHASHISYACVEACYYQLSFIDGLVKLDIACLDMDTGAGGSGSQILDASNVGRGEIRVRGLGATEGKPAVSGGALMRIINADQIPGTIGVTQPAVPASTVAFKNDFYRDALVCITGGTVTAIAIADSGGGNSLTLGITSGPIVVASGKQITLTYSVAPTWTWTLL